MMETRIERRQRRQREHGAAAAGYRALRGLEVVWSDLLSPAPCDTSGREAGESAGLRREPQVSTR